MVRQGGSRVFFDIVGQMQAAKLISDAEEMGTVVQAIMLDAFDGIKGSLDGIFDSVGAAIDAVREPAMALGESRVYFEKFFDFDGVRQYEESIIDLGLAFGVAGNEALDAGSRMAQLGGIFGSGAGIEAGTGMGTAFGLIGNMESEEAQKRMISIAQQTGFLYEGIGEAAFKAADAETQRQIVIRNSLYMMDQLNTVESNSVATVQQISQVMDQFAASATAANMSIAEQASLSAILVEQGETASKAGRGLKQMLVRIASDTGGAATALHEFGVATTDINGDMIGLTRIMQQLSDNGFHQLDSTQQQQIATSVAGSNHAERFMKLMNKQERAVELTNQAINREVGALDELIRFTGSATFAADQMAAAQENLSAKIGEELLPAMTDAQFGAFYLKSGLLAALTVNEEASGLSGEIDGIVAGLTQGAARGIVMANAMYELGGGAFEAAMNVSSLLISVRVYRAIMKQNLDLQNMISQGLLGQRGAQQQINMLEGVSVSKSGKVLFMKSMMKTLDSEMLALEEGKVGMMTKKERVQAAQLQAQSATVSLANTELTQLQNVARLKATAKSMTDAEITTGRIASEAKLTAAIQEEQKLKALIALKGEEAMIDGMTASQKLAETQIVVATANQELNTIFQVINAKTQLGNIETREVSILNQETQARIMAMQKKREEFIQTINLLRATGHLTEAEHKEIMTKIMGINVGKKKIETDKLTVASLMTVKGALMGTSMAMKNMSAVTSLASMGLMMFSDSEDAMQAASLLMIASMLPMIKTMFAFKTTTDGAIASSLGFKAVTTGLLGLVAVGAAFAVAKGMMKNTMEDMQDISASTIDDFGGIQAAASDFAFELDRPGGATDLMMDFGNTTAESMDKAEKSVTDFMSAREELFFGFSASRMNQTLFEQLVNQGVGELYYRTELNIANNFFGLTVDEMVDQVTVQVQENLVAITGS